MSVCGICTEEYTCPYVINCGHTFCLECLYLYGIINHARTCPFCREIIVSAVPNYAIETNNTNNPDDKLASIKEEINGWNKKDKNITTNNSTNGDVGIYIEESLANLIISYENRIRIISDVFEQSGNIPEQLNNILQATQIQESSHVKIEEYKYIDKKRDYTGFDLCLLLKSKNLQYNYFGSTKSTIEKKIGTHVVNNLHCLSYDEAIFAYSEWIENNTVLTQEVLNLLDFDMMKRILSHKFRCSANSKNKATNLLLNQNISLNDILPFDYLYY